MTEAVAETPLQILQRLEGAAEVVVHKGPDGRFLPKDGGTATSTESPEKPVASPVKDAETPKETTASPDMDKALTALRRAKAPPSVIELLRSGDKAIHEWAAVLQKQQAETDRLYREKGKDSKPDAGAPAKAADATAEAKDSPNPEDAAEQGIDPVFAQMRDILAEQARSRLAASLPQLSDPKVWADVYPKAKELMESGAYDELGDNWSEIADTIITDALMSTGHRPSPTAPSAARAAGHGKPAKSDDRFEGLKGQHPALIRLKLMEDHGLTPDRADEVARKLGA